MSGPETVTTVQIGPGFVLHFDTTYGTNYAAAQELAGYDQNKDGVISEGDFDGDWTAVANVVAHAIDPMALDTRLSEKVFWLAQAVNYGTQAEPAIRHIRSRFNTTPDLFLWFGTCEISAETYHTLGGQEGLRSLSYNLVRYRSSVDQLQRSWADGNAQRSAKPVDDPATWGYGVFFPVVEKLHDFRTLFSLESTCLFLSAADGDEGYRLMPMRKVVERPLL